MVNYQDRVAREIEAQRLSGQSSVRLQRNAPLGTQASLNDSPPPIVVANAGTVPRVSTSSSVSPPLLTIQPANAIATPTRSAPSQIPTVYSLQEQEILQQKMKLSLH